jgi:hypothetical protein
MRLPVVQKKKSKKVQTLDTVASVAKAWSEWQLAKGAVKTAKKAPWKIIAAATAGAAAIGLGAKKVLGGGKSSTPTPPAPPAYTGPVEDPNAPGAKSNDIAGPAATGVHPDPEAPGSTDGPVAAPDVHTDPEAPATPDK